MNNKDTFKPNEIYSNETYHKMKGNKFKPNYCPVNETNPGYGDPETIGTFSTTVNKRAKVPPHANYNNKTEARPKTSTIKKCAFCSEQHNPVHCGSYQGLGKRINRLWSDHFTLSI